MRPLTLTQMLLHYYGTPEMKQRAKEPGEAEKLEQAVAQVLKEQTIIIHPRRTQNATGEVDA